jgi:hypothetical protein
MGDRMSINIYEQNMANASKTKAVQRTAALSLNVNFSVIIVMVMLLIFKEGKITKK